MTGIRSIARTALGQWSRIGADKGIKQLRSEGGPDGERLAAVLERALHPDSGPSTDWFNRIEALRTELSADETTLSITDFGAGSTGDNRSQAEMEEGVQIERTVQQACNASKAPFWASILHHLILEFRPTTGIELGTCLGLSAAYQASAMEINGEGQLLTLEGADSLADISTKHLRGLGLGDRAKVVPGRFADTLDAAISELGAIEYAFIDGHHDEHATIAYFEQLLPHLADRAVLVFDDTSWTEGMIRAWKKIQSHDAVRLTLDLGAVGICVLDASIENRTSVEISLKGL